MDGTQAGRHVLLSLFLCGFHFLDHVNPLPTRKVKSHQRWEREAAEGTKTESKVISKLKIVARRAHKIVAMS
jgi:hypothetical protein